MAFSFGAQHVCLSTNYNSRSSPVSRTSSRRTSLAVQDPELSSPYAGLRRRSSAVPPHEVEMTQSNNYASRRPSIYNERLPATFGTSHLFAPASETISQRRGSIRADKANARKQPDITADSFQNPFASSSTPSTIRSRSPRPIPQAQSSTNSTSFLNKARVSIGTIPMTMRDLIAKRSRKNRFTAARALIRLGAVITIIYFAAKLIGAIFPASPLSSLPSVIPQQLPFDLPILSALIPRMLIPGMAKPTQSPRQNAAVQAERRKEMMHRFKKEMLWKEPDSHLEIKVIKETIGHPHENTVIFLHVRSLSAPV